MKQHEFWRYLPFESLVWMVQQKAIWMSSIVALQKLDVNEGWAKIAMSDPPADNTDVVVELPNADTVGVSCWHQVDRAYDYFGETGENLALWEIYARRGVAIVSTREKIESSLGARLNPVVYGELKNAYNFFGGYGCIKNPAYSFENEFRALRDFERPTGGAEPPPGWVVSVSLEDLVERIVVSPYYVDWQVDVVRQLAQGIPVERSRVRDRSSAPHRP